MPKPQARKINGASTTTSPIPPLSPSVAAPAPLGPAVPGGPAIAEPEAPSPIVTLSMSEGDRWFVATMLNEIPWGGGEKNVTTMGQIYESLRLGDVDLGKVPAALGKAAEKFELTARECEIVLKIICGFGNKAIPGFFGPQLAKLVARVRLQITAAVDKK